VLGWIHREAGTVKPGGRSGVAVSSLAGAGVVASSVVAVISISPLAVAV
jgi:hypothetical protein